MNVTTLIIGLAAGLVVGFISQYLINRFGLKAKRQSIIDDAHKEAEVIKRNKLLEVKEKFLNKKADLEKEVAARNQKIQQIIEQFVQLNEGITELSNVNNITAEDAGNVAQVVSEVAT